jgi:hypothetical protein
MEDVTTTNLPAQRSVHLNRQQMPSRAHGLTAVDTIHHIIVNKRTQGGRPGAQVGYTAMLHSAGKLSPSYKSAIWCLYRFVVVPQASS